MSTEIDPTARVHPSTQFEGAASIGFCSYVGHGCNGEDPVRVGDGVRIGAFCMIGSGTVLGRDVEVDHYCRIAQDVLIGIGTRVLYGAQVYDDVKVGTNCIIGGDLVDRTVLEDFVRFQGETVHSHTDATGDWEKTVEAAPIIRRNSVVGVGALVIGGISVGPRAFVAAGERVSCDVPEGMVLKEGVLQRVEDFRGLIKLRSE